MYKVILFGEIRPFVSKIDRISICMLETLGLEEFRSINEVPHSYDGKYLRGFGVIGSEFEPLCMMITLSDTPR